MSQNNIEAELSYAYLHAVASRAGFSCEITGRHSDGAGVDVVLRVLEEKLDSASLYTQFPVDVQLKATTKVPALENGRYSYFVQDVARYDRLRNRSGPFPTLLVVLFLPQDPTAWLSQTEEALVSRKCAYWVSLWGAPPSGNTTGQTVYLPQTNMLSVSGLRELLKRLSLQEELTYGT